MSNKLKYWLISGQHWGIAYSEVLKWGFSLLRLVNFEKKQKKKNHRFKLPIFDDNHGAHFSVDKKIYWMGNNFWAMGLFNLLGGQ